MDVTTSLPATPRPVQGAGGRLGAAPRAAGEDAATVTASSSATAAREGMVVGGRVLCVLCPAKEKAQRVVGPGARFFFFWGECVESRRTKKTRSTDPASLSRIEPRPQCPTHPARHHHHPHHHNDTTTTFLLHPNSAPPPFRHRRRRHLLGVQRRRAAAQPTSRHVDVHLVWRGHGGGRRQEADSSRPAAVDAGRCRGRSPHRHHRRRLLRAASAFPTGRHASIHC